MKVVGYARVSTDLQREKETINTQTDLIRSFCEKQGHTLIATFSDEGVSGTVPLSERPEGKKLMEAAKRREFDAVVVYKSDRIGRDVYINETVARELHDTLGVLLLGVAETIDLTTSAGRAMFTFHAVLGRMERENTLQRSHDATIRLAKEGIWLGGIAPFGYRVDGKDKEAKLVISDEVIPDVGKSEADIIRMIYQMSAEEGLSCHAISTRLNVMNVPTSYFRDEREIVRNKRKQKTQGVWRPARIRNMIVETTYKGIHQWGKRGSRRRPKDKPREIIERRVPAIVDEVMWQRAQETLRKNFLVRPDVEKQKYLLRGLMKCVHCGLTYTGTAHKGRNADRLKPHEIENAKIRDGRVLRLYYSCNGRNSSHQIYGLGEKPCASGAIKAQELESMVWSDLEDFLQNPGDIIHQLRTNLEGKLADTKGLQQTITQLRKNMEAKEKERENVYRLYRTGRMNDVRLDAQLQEIDADEEALKTEIHHIEAELSKAQNANESLHSAENMLVKLQSSLASELSWEAKRQIVEALVESIEIESLQTEKGRTPKVNVKYRFEKPSGASNFAQANIVNGVRVETCWGLQRIHHF